MKPFVIELADTSGTRRIDDAVSFVGEDASGSFGLMAGHARFMTVLRFGLARYRRADGAWQYLGMPGAVLEFAADRLWLGARRFLLDEDYTRICRLLSEQLADEERSLHDTKVSLRRMEEELLRRLWQLGERGRVDVG